MAEYDKASLCGFDNVLKELSKGDRSLFMRAAACVYSVRPDDVRRFDYDAAGEKWTVWESPAWKIIGNEGGTFNELFSKSDGLTVKFGRSVGEDPEWCPLGPDIADIEIVAGKCPKINGRNCAFCYKGNGGDVARCMTLGEFKELLDFMPKNLCQIAFGITGYYTNPDFPAMVEYAKSKGVICNYTTNGVDLDEVAISHTVENCGRIAVSCYEGAKDICYRMLRRVGEAARLKGRDFPCNIHVVLSKATLPHVMSVLEDARDGKIDNLGAVVVLRMKPVGRAANLDCSVPAEVYEKIVRFCLDNGVKFGFDSCGAAPVAETLKRMGRDDLLECIESCESSRYSSYFNWKREYWNCSFCEGNAKIMNAIDPFAFNDFQSFWNSEEVNDVRFPKEKACRSCPWYRLD